MSLLAVINQDSQLKVIYDTVNLSLDCFIIHLTSIFGWRLQFDALQDNLGRKSSSKR